MKKKIIGILVMMLLITPIAIGSIEEPKEETENSKIEDMSLYWTWKIGIEIDNDPPAIGNGLAVGEADDGHDGPPADVWDGARVLGNPDGDFYSIDGFGPLFWDCRHYPNTEKRWHLYYADSGNPRDCTIRIAWVGNSIGLNVITDFEYTKCIFYVHVGNQHINMNQESDYTYNHKSGDTDHFEVRLYVNDAPNYPVNPTGPTSLLVGEEGEYSAQTTDPEGDNLKYWFHFDGPSGSKYKSTSYLPSGTQGSVTRSFSSPGKHSVSAWAEDEWGNVCAVSNPLTITVNEEQVGEPPETPEILDAPSFMQYGETYAFTAVTTDPDGDDVRYGFTWDYEGDWTYVDTDFMESGVPCTEEQSFESPGHTMHMTMDVGAMDTNGLMSGWCEPIGMTISDPPTEVYITGPTSGSAGEEYVYHIRGYDPNSNDLVDFAIDWGDGDDVFISDIPIMSEVNVSHIWSSEGDYQISVTVYDFNCLGGPTETLSVSMPKVKTHRWFHPWLSDLFERFPFLEPWLQQFPRLQ